MISAIKQGDDFAFEQAFIQYRQKLYAYFLAKTRSPEDAADLMQTVFLKLWQYRSSLNDLYTLDQQLFYIARTVLIDHTRKLNKQFKVQTVTQLQEQKNYQLVPSEEVDVNMQLQNALSSLPELRKKIFVLHKLYGYSYKEIAEMLSIPVKAVDNNLSKALQHLRKVFMLLIVVLINIL
ncbi:RNA polymerase sigma-70 factor [soil metagenome]